MKSIKTSLKPLTYINSRYGSLYFGLIICGLAVKKSNPDRLAAWRDSRLD